MEVAPKKLTKDQAITAALKEVPGEVDSFNTKEINGMTLLFS